jgi:prepilin peptidase CpaA
MSLLALLPTLCLIAFGALLAAAAWQDLRTMLIANRLSIAVVGVFAVWAAASLMLGRMTVLDAGLAVLFATLVFIVGALAFAAGALGGGDVKLLAAASLFAGPAHLTDLLIVMAVVGGAMGVAIALGVQIGPANATKANGDGTVARSVSGRLRGHLPYGPAIAAGGLWTIIALI